MAMWNRTRTIPILAFLICLPPAFFVGITLIGHARPFPYVSVWLDRFVLIVIALGLPLLAGYGAYRLVSPGRKRKGSHPVERKGSGFKY